PASFLAVASKAALSAQVSRGHRISAGTPGQEATTSKPKTGSRRVRPPARLPLWIASTMARVWTSLIRLPVPCAPPLQPVFTSPTRALCCFILAARSSAYLLGCHTRNGPPKQGENVAEGSLTPTSVPATFAV